MNELYLIKSGDNGFVEETSAVISADSGEISINDSLYVESAGNIGIGSSNPVNKLDVVGSASISSDLTVQGITFTNVGGNSPSAVNDIIKYDGNNWVVAASTTLPGGGGGGSTNSDVPAGLITTLTQGDAIHEVDFGYDSNNDRIVYDNVPKIAASLEIDGAGEIIPHTVSGVSESGYYVVFSEELPTANYRMHTVFGGTDAFWETGVANLEYSERNVEIDRSLFVGQKVGIGTTNPSEGLLHLSQTDNDAIKIERTDSGSNNASIYIGHSGGGLGISTSGRIGVTNPDFFISSTGNVGIGTTNAANKLHIQQGVLTSGSTNSNTSVTIEDASNTGIQFLSAGQTQLRFGDAANNGAGSILYKHADDQLILNTSSVIALQGGNVGIGTTNPINDLHIHGATTGVGPILQLSNDTGDCRLFFGTDSTTGGANAAGQIRYNVASNYMGFYSNLNERMRIDASGHVGIGTTSPTAPLHIVNSSNHFVKFGYGGTNGEHQLRWDSATAQLHANFNQVSTSNNRRIVLGVDASEKMSILHDGSVGIGTTVASGDGWGDNMLRIYDSATASAGTDASPQWSDSLFLQRNIQSNYQGTRILFAHGKASIGGFREDASVDAAHHLCFYTGDTNSVSERMRIKSNGNVGIGTTSPTTKLTVNGMIYGTTTAIFGNLSVSSDVQTNADKELVTTSDKRLKNDLGDCEYGLNEVLQVQPKKYTWKSGPEDQKPTVGFFAQDVHPIMPEAAPREAIQNENGEDDYRWGFHSQTIIAALVNATKEQQAMIEDLKSEIEQLKS